VNRDELDEFAAGLFAAARGEAPDAALLERVLATEPVPLASLHASATLRRPTPRSSAARWLLLAAVVSAAALALVVGLTEGGSNEMGISAERRMPGSRPPSEPPAATLPSVPPEKLFEPGQPDAAPNTTPPAPKRAASKPAPVRKAETQPEPRSLSSELNLLVRARAALRSHHEREALALLDRYDSEPFGNELSTEAELLRVEALASLGRRAEATARARRFVRDNPDSPLVDRAQSFIVEP
jgi:hypothetical protein